MGASLGDYISQSQRASIMAPIEKAMTLPRAAYVEEGFLSLEWERIFRRRWIAIGFAHSVPDPGDIMPIQIGGMPVLVLRNMHGTIALFHNVCPYDGCPVALKADRGLEHLVTPYHGWRYDLDGHLIAAPYSNGRPEGDLDILKERETDLKPIRSAVWGNVICADFSGEAEPFDEFILPVTRLLKHVNVQHLLPIQSVTGETLVLECECKTNWKTYFENACINILHESFVHDVYSQSNEFPRVNSDGEKMFENVIDGDLFAFTFNMASVAHTYGMDDETPHIGDRPEHKPGQAWFGTLYPNFYFALQPTFLELGLVLPDGPGRVIDRRIYLADPVAATDPSFLTFRAELPSLFNEASCEDQPVVEAIQVGRGSPAFEQNYYLPFWDVLHHAFLQKVLCDLEDVAREGAVQ